MSVWEDLPASYFSWKPEALTKTLWTHIKTDVNKWSERQLCSISVNTLQFNYLKISPCQQPCNKTLTLRWGNVFWEQLGFEEEELPGQRFHLCEYGDFNSHLSLAWEEQEACFHSSLLHAFGVPQSFVLVSTLLHPITLSNLIIFINLLTSATESSLEIYTRFLKPY